MPESVTTAPKSPPGSDEQGGRTQVQVALISVAGTIVAALISAAALIYTGWAQVPSLDGSPPLDDLVGEVDRLQAENEQHVAKIAQLTRDLEAERTKPSPSPSVSPRSPVESPLVEAGTFEVALSTLDDTDRMAVLDIDANVSGTLLLDEWADRKGASEEFDVAMEAVGATDYGVLEFANLTSRSSASGAPASGDECRRAIEEDGYELSVHLDDLKAGDVFCTRTSLGAIALITVADVDTVNPTVMLKATVYQK